MHIDPHLLGHTEKPIELRQPLRVERIGLGEERAISEKDADAIDPQLLHAGEVLSRGVRIELLPELRSPTGAWAIVVHPHGNERPPVGRLESTALGRHAHLRKGSSGPSLVVGGHRPHVGRGRNAKPKREAANKHNASDHQLVPTVWVALGFTADRRNDPTRCPAARRAVRLLPSRTFGLSIPPPSGQAYSGQTVSSPRIIPCRAG